MSVDLKSISFPSKMGQGLADISAKSVQSVIQNIQSVGGKKINNSIFDNTSDEVLQKLNNFLDNQPHILFTCDYVVDEQEIGALIVFQKYFDATHYEVFKDNKFDNDPEFERILFLNSEALKEETKRFLPYVRDILGFELDETSCFIILDDNIKKDRIYEYFIRAAFLPSDIRQIIYTVIMKSKDQLKTVEVGTNQSVLSLALSLLSSQQFAWIISLLNPKIPFFGKSAVDTNIFDIQKNVLIPKNNDDLMKIIKDSIYLFGAKIALSSLISDLGSARNQLGILNEEITQIFIDSIDESRGFFSADFFRKKMIEVSNSFKLFSNIAGSSGESEKKKQLFSAGVSVPAVTGELSFNSLQSLSDILNLVRTIDYAITYVRDNLEQSTSSDSKVEQSVVGSISAGILTTKQNG